MKGLDTNILLRYLMQDEVVQSAKASKLIESLTAENPGFISLVSLAEFYWVLDHKYKLSKIQIIEALESLVTSETLVVEENPRIERALDLYRLSNADFDDCLIVETASSFACDAVYTFDKTAAKSGFIQLLV